jgi:hypothetical protein
MINRSSSVHVQSYEFGIAREDPQTLRTGTALPFSTLHASPRPPRDARYATKRGAVDRRLQQVLCEMRTTTKRVGSRCVMQWRSVSQ